jgi:hypothetical protein
MPMTQRIYRLWQVSLNLQQRCIQMFVKDDSYRLVLPFKHMCGKLQLGTSEATGERPQRWMQGWW